MKQTPYDLNDLDYANSQPNENELIHTEHLKGMFNKDTSDIEKQLQWFNHFVDYVGNEDSNINLLIKLKT